MRVAVTGAGGYLGAPLVDALAADERIEEVVAIDARPSRAIPAGVRAVMRDVRDPELRRDLEGCDALMHLAFRVLGRGVDAVSVNVGGSRNAFDAAVGARVGTIVHASSAAAYGSAPDTPVPVAEDHPLRSLPPFYYPQTKVAVEHMLDQLEARHGELRVVRMRPVSTVGPGAPTLLGGRAFLTLSDFDPLMQFTWLDDVVAAFEAALHAPSASGAYNVGAPGPVRASEVAGLMGVRRLRAPHAVLRAAASVACRARLPGALHPAWVDTARHPIVVDTRRAESRLGWRASGDSAAALRRYGKLQRARPAPWPRPTIATTREAS